MKIRIKEARQAYRQRTGIKLTQAQLALATMHDYSGSLKSKMDVLNRMQRGEYNHPRLELIERIAIVCGVDYNFLIINEN